MEVHHLWQLWAHLLGSSPAAAPSRRRPTRTPTAPASPQSAPPRLALAACACLRRAGLPAPAGPTRAPGTALHAATMAPLPPRSRRALTDSPSGWGPRRRLRRDRAGRGVLGLRSRRGRAQGVRRDDRAGRRRLGLGCHA
ncbi:hypothetical protein ACP70R_007497 [Stipagrostis hirtigluma subsp. patula]